LAARAAKEISMEDSRHPGLIVNGLRFLAPKEAFEVLQEGALLVDLRIDVLVAMKAFQVPNWVHMPHRELREGAAQLPKDRLLVLADASGVYLRGAAEFLGTMGFKQIACLNGGMLHWDDAGLPVGTDPDHLLHGPCPCQLKPGKGRAH
jgi:rhodanese-related sulfurtransferase